MFVGRNLVPRVDQAILSAADLHIGIGRFGHYRNTNAQMLRLGSLRFVDCGFGSALQITEQVDLPTRRGSKIEITLIPIERWECPCKATGRALQRLSEGS